MIRRYISLATLALSLTAAIPAFAASQDKYTLPEPYLGMEKAYLTEMPDLQKVMDVMIATEERQVKDPTQDILHNRLCAAFVYKMAMDQKMPDADRKKALAGDLLHNIAKEEKEAVLTDTAQLTKARDMVTALKQAGYLKNSPRFWSDEQVLTNPKIGGNRALIHHITGAVMAGEMLKEIGSFQKADIEAIQAAIVEHSTGYWYFRASIDKAAGKQGAWESVYPEPENDIAKFTHDADLISQFVPESVVPDGSKWRELAKKRWGAKTPQEEGHIVYYVFQRLFDEAKTPSGKKMARERWNQIAPALVKLTGLKDGEDPTKVLGVPAVFSN
ncbi:hypothetical protein OCAR_5851 [Afipia carboxidovorans OM5]|uniref:HD domain-containing protein n=1 Tax=Afipia carboxidovorans (strain ATCC 49405 / DSM 1227 / KCTC 32145 / OM5) TaxID=504832 RepID=B6JGH0_AFIC5|nr:hypothetical protein [Afipia carboxidovorans]ACI92976.1 hypothetical protein OCAR_5851 [Afipia carboxidovorans OM5]AEI03292.1 hypothetical protein OCA4_c21650 [Afipia carboxidovorans OM4]AEI06869.1 hypothetical protein OCA5_c21660 [Afipia carboxidovorans OM5]